MWLFILWICWCNGKILKPEADVSFDIEDCIRETSVSWLWERWPLHTWTGRGLLTTTKKGSGYAGMIFPPSWKPFPKRLHFLHLNVLCLIDKMYNVRIWADITDADIMFFTETHGWTHRLQTILLTSMHIISLDLIVLRKESLQYMYKTI